METGMSSGYLAAMAASYANQEGGITIPADRLSEIVEIPLGFQPMGICAKPAGDGDDIAIADYFGPAICRSYVKRDEKGLNFAVNWIRGAKHGIENVRLFPDVASPGGANRAQTVNFGPVGTLWVSRNAGREFFVLSPDVKCGWRLVEKVALPDSVRMVMVHSALLDFDRLYTIESSDDLSGWVRVVYRITLMNDFAPPFRVERESMREWFYGGVAWKIGTFVVTDFRAALPHGIYDVSGDSPRLIVPGVWGTGICFLSDGSALVSRHGQSHSAAFNGLPGALIYVPARMFA